MHLQRYDDGVGFLEAAGEYLYRDEVIHGVLIGVAGRAEDHTAEGQTPYLATISDHDQIRAVAVMTPPHRLLIGADPQDQGVLDVLVEDLRQAGRMVPGVTGPVAVADAFATTWSRGAAFDLRRGMAMMVFELRQVRRPTGVSGQPRWARPEEVDLLADWVDAFNVEVHQTPRPSLEQVRERVLERIHSQNVLVWEDEGRPVSLASRSRPSPRGTAINCVRTPPAYRRRGYASACVAELSQRILDDGKLFCTLFTDLANPTSNHIYGEIGFESRGEFVELHFD
ncbi:MAG: GNAT family N-acetyltransferase [Gemmatimonadetes bacterium]|nr:GNAT family N-acetyltransferase [Gemmatimonadota bacterium]MBT6147587.1 GNAT family N-acetyltransferase [Gemmatimonadota bacterium]MBT7863249.1 GNAT family N-acetyltransferase [Gemmatimonadota bacterium]